MTSTPSGTGTPPPTAQGGQAKAEKPTLSGTRIKQRKGVVKSQAKFEPEAFRDAVYKYFDGVSATDDWDGYAAALDKAGNTLDYRKYSDQLFEILIAGNLLAPGGSPLDDAPSSPFSVFAAKSGSPADVKPIITTLDKVIRRYKFLQKPLDEHSIKYLLQYIGRFDAGQRERLATATAFLIQMSLVSASCLLVLQKDNLTKDEVALNFIINVFKAYLAEGSIDTLSTSLRKGRVTDVLPFFPQTKRSQANIVTSTFSSAGLTGVANFYAKLAARDAREAVIRRLHELRENLDVVQEPVDGAAEESNPRVDEIVDYLNESGLPAEERIATAWEGLMKDQDPNFVKHVTPVFAAIVKGPRNELALINAAQTHVSALGDQASMKTFPGFLKLWYNEDVVSDSAIIFWHTKGHKTTQGYQAVLQVAAPLVKYLQEQEEEDD
ncbi:ARM repeat-containing protein [Ceraceosorus guamensis]|uniref:ARM repeat-containing protein n=1 Tax=Ceraceosorus guamensis TaxID=1522189 RepID=A0A316W2R3_9BASI|nr:ARM repeat-containing protein [Ceraceosorus guamensis]PWN43388.1 ARM repeat-containing protein [Ceraceosorus guamensis]